MLHSPKRRSSQFNNNVIQHVWSCSNGANVRNTNGQIERLPHLQNVSEERVKLCILARQASDLLGDLFQKVGKHQHHLLPTMHKKLIQKRLNQPSQSIRDTEYTRRVGAPGIERTLGKTLEKHASSSSAGGR